mgnify:CR=1 FL=1
MPADEMQEPRPVQIAAAIAHHMRRQPQAQRSDAHLVAQMQPHAPHQARIRPHRAARRNSSCNMRCAIINQDLAAQRIARFHRLNFSQQILLRRRHHAEKGRSLHNMQAALQRGSAIRGRQRARRSEAQVRAQQAGSLLLQGQPHAIREQADGGD